MHPNGGENQPQAETRPLPTGESESLPLPERGTVSTPENSPQKQPAQQVASQVASDLALPATSIVTDDGAAVSTDATDSTSSSAADSDRIEKEWIDKAKTVISQTKDDPFEQKNAMSKVKAEYIQKRFNKTVKTDDTVKRWPF